MTQPKAVLCHSHFILAIFSILFGILLSPSVVYAVPMQTKSQHDIHPGYRYHIVQYEDTLYNIARRYGTTINAIRQANGLHDSYIQIGWRLAIPGSQLAHPLPNHCYIQHSVEMGETLFSIARSYNIPVPVLLQANPISDPNNIKAGQQLCIPKFEQSQPNNVTHTPKPCSATSCCQTDCTPAPTPTEIPCAPLSCCQTHCAPMPTSTPTATPMPTATFVPTETQCDLSCCQTNCCHTHCLLTPIATFTSVPSTPTVTATPTATPMPTVTPTSTVTPTPTKMSCDSSCCQTNCCHTDHCYPTPNPAISTTVPMPTPQGFWYGEYFDTNGSRSTRDDPEINFNWHEGGPENMPNVVDDFSVRWSKTEYFDAGIYRFNAVVDDGIIVRIDDQIILESWYEAPVHYRDVQLEAGDHTIEVEYYEKGGDARVSLNWTKRSSRG